MRAVLAAALLLTACGPVREDPPAPTPVEAVAAEIPEPAPEPAPSCDKADRDWLRQRAAAEGSILRVFEVSKARRTIIEQLNSQLAKITAALERGCLEAP